jgi:hypothetical protein
MDKTTIALIGLLAVLFIGQVYINENFYNFYSDDASGNITLSLSDLMTLIGPTSGVKSLTEESDTSTSTYNAGHYREYNNMRDDIRRDIRKVIKDEMIQKKFTEESDVVDDSCLDSLSAQQGADFMRYIPGKNPDDYIRKDSVPCYGCSIPT